MASIWYKSVVQSSVHWSDFHRSSVRILIRQNFLTKNSFTTQALEKWYAHLLLGKVHVGANIFNFLLALTKEFFLLFSKTQLYNRECSFYIRFILKLKCSMKFWLTLYNWWCSLYIRFILKCSIKFWVTLFVYIKTRASANITLTLQ